MTGIECSTGITKLTEVVRYKYIGANVSTMNLRKIDTITILNIMEKLARVIKDHQGTIVAVALVVLFACIQDVLTNDVLLRGNYGVLNWQVRKVLDVSVLVLLFGLIKLFVYKYLHG